jgi:adhesin transport system outer membrane protein
MNFTRKTLLLAATLTLLAVLAGCAAKKGTGSYVVRLRDPDGNAGKVIVQSPQGEQTLTEVFKGAALDGKREPFFVMQDQLQRDFGAALAAMPPLPDLNQKPMRFGRETSLTNESASDLQNTARAIVASVRAGKSLDISIIGHADTTPPAPGDTNQALGLRRADAVRELLRRHLLDAGLRASEIPPMTTASHGDRNPFNKANPADVINRRVEITIR